MPDLEIPLGAYGIAHHVYKRSAQLDADALDSALEAAADGIVAAELDRLVRVLAGLWIDPMGQFTADQAHAARVMKRALLDQLTMRATELRGEGEGGKPDG